MENGNSETYLLTHVASVLRTVLLKCTMCTRGEGRTTSQKITRRENRDESRDERWELNTSSKVIFGIREIAPKPQKIQRINYKF